MEVVERGIGCGRCGRPPVRVCLNFFYPSSEALAAEAGLHFLLVLVESPI